MEFTKNDATNYAETQIKIKLIRIILWKQSSVKMKMFETDIRNTTLDLNVSKLWYAL